MDVEMENANTQENEMSKLDIIIQKLGVLEVRLSTLEMKTVALGTNCHKAFLQIREAMHTLREELGDAAGIIVQDTWLD